MRITYLVALLVITGCNKTNTNYCDGAIDDNCMNLGGERCRSDTECSGDTPFCKTEPEPRICVECLNNDVCGGATPACRDNRCAPCTLDDECDSQACLEAGVCADEANVIYAKRDGLTTPGCGSRTGGNECSLEQALEEVDATRNIIRLNPETYDLQNGLTITEPTTLVARRSIIKRSNGVLITVDNTLKLIGGTLQGPNNNHGIQCNSDRTLQVHEVTIEDMFRTGIQGDSCNLTVSRSTLRRNLRGGISMLNDPKIALITNNFIVDNGQGDASETGGMVLRLAAGSKVEFNTVADNTANRSSGTAGGVKCDGSYNAPNNIIYRNNGGVNDDVEVSGTCTFQDSYTTHDEMNMVRFKDPDAGMDYHLMPDSPDGTIRNVSVCTTVDFDGDLRPVGEKCDLGADEFVPPQ